MVLKVAYAVLIYILLILSIVLVISVRSDRNLDNPSTNPLPTVQPTTIPTSDCIISTTQDLVKLSPLLLQQNDAVDVLTAFILPDERGTITLKSGDKIDFACPGENVLVIDGVNRPWTIIEATCESGLKFKIEGKSALFDTIKCAKEPESVARYTQKSCGDEKKEIEIGFVVFDRFIRQLLICYDDNLQTSLYSQADLTCAINNTHIKTERPLFIQGDFYNVAPQTLTMLYYRETQRNTINNILGREANDTTIIQNNNDYFLSKGHYAAMGDFIYAQQQIATFWYLNTAPQWQRFNGGNWNSMEISCRNLAINRKLDLTIITGSHGISKVLDEESNKQELYLLKDKTRKGIPVPQLFFRVVYDSKSKSGVALVGVNNPYNKYEDDVICADICDKIKWLTWDRTNVSLGYSYCCGIDDLRKTIKFIPPLDVKSLLV